MMPSKDIFEFGVAMLPFFFMVSALYGFYLLGKVVKSK